MFGSAKCLSSCRLNVRDTSICQWSLVTWQIGNWKIIVKVDNHSSYPKLAIFSQPCDIVWAYTVYRHFLDHWCWFQSPLRLLDSQAGWCFHLSCNFGCKPHVWPPKILTERVLECLRLRLGYSAGKCKWSFFLHGVQLTEYGAGTPLCVYDGSHVFVFLPSDHILPRWTKAWSDQNPTCLPATVRIIGIKSASQQHFDVLSPFANLKNLGLLEHPISVDESMWIPQKKTLNIDTLWWTNIEMENHHF